MKLNPYDITEVAMPFMQETHLEEIEMLNALYILFEKSRNGAQVAELASTIEAIAKHTHEHFERENAQMLAQNFPPYPIHKQAHDQHLDELDEVITTWRASGDLAPVMTFFEITTPEWMKQHISTMDFVTANFFVMHAQNT